MASLFFRFLVGLLIGAASSSASASPLTEGTPVVYSESYVWYLSDRLANTAMSRLFTRSLPADVAHQFQFDLALLYHHRLIACDGPLDQIADAVKFSALATPQDAGTANVDDVLNALGKTDSLVQSILEAWNDSVFPEISRVFRAGQGSTVFPKCVNTHYTPPRPL
ncbi:hypothetical protein [Burkholderia territorii]|uniref:hypothetical protein n=1 Tax=Burkholderia territorii TaxID=1503055 RepID=UPI0012D9705B|nr:hypothetical protein [Burkholderia territorii]